MWTLKVNKLFFTKNWVQFFPRILFLTFIMYLKEIQKLRNYFSYDFKDFPIEGVRKVDCKFRRKYGTFCLHAYRSQFIHITLSHNKRCLLIEHLQFGSDQLVWIKNYFLSLDLRVSNKHGYESFSSSIQYNSKKNVWQNKFNILLTTLMLKGNSYSALQNSIRILVCR